MVGIVQEVEEMAKTIVSQVDAGTYYLVTYSDGTEEKLYKSEQKYPPRTMHYNTYCMLKDLNLLKFLQSKHSI